MSDQDKRLEKQITTLGITKEDTERTVQTVRGEFLVKALLPFEKGNVLRQVSSQIDEGTSLYVEEAAYVRKIATLNICIKKAPEWWTSAAECYDEELINKLFNEYVETERLLAEKLKKNNPSGS